MICAEVTPDGALSSVGWVEAKLAKARDDKMSWCLIATNQALDLKSLTDSGLDLAVPDDKLADHLGLSQADASAFLFHKGWDWGTGYLRVVRAASLREARRRLEIAFQLDSRAEMSGRMPAANSARVPTSDVVPNDPTVERAVRSRSTRSVAAAVVIALGVALMGRWSLQPRSPTIIAVTSFSANGAGSEPVVDYINTRIISALSEVNGLRVFDEPVLGIPPASRKKTNYKKRLRKALNAAQKLGASILISGEVVGNDAPYGVMLKLRRTADRSVFRELPILGNDDPFDLVRSIVVELCSKLAVEITPKEMAAIGEQREVFSKNVFAVFAESSGAAASSPPDGGRPWNSQPAAPDAGSWNLLSPSPAFAAESDAEINLTLEKLQRALETRRSEAVAEFYVKVPETMKKTMDRYFDLASGLTVKFSEIQVQQLDESGALVRYLREDHFKEADTERDVDLRMRVNSVFVKTPSGWKIDLGARP